MFFRSIRNYAVKAIALLFATVLSAGVAGSYARPVDVNADEDLYPSLYDLFRERSGDPENFIPEKDRIAVFDMDGTLTCETV